MNLNVGGPVTAALSLLDTSAKIALEMIKDLTPEQKQKIYDDLQDRIAWVRGVVERIKD